MSRAIAIGVGIGAALTLTQASEPAWWRDSANGTNIMVDPASASPVEGNYVPVNSGQAKNVSKKAALYLNNELAPVEVGAAVNDLVGNFRAGPDDYSPLNIGQLKAIAKPFYDRLIDLGFNTQNSLASHGTPGWNKIYPWDPNTPVSENYRIANIGQLKWVFSFDLTGFAIVDGDSDEMADTWESNHNASDPGGDPDLDGLTNLEEYRLGSDPNDYYSQGRELIVPRLAVYSGNGIYTPYGEYSEQPIIFKIVNAKTGATLVNAPVSIDVTGAGQIASAQQGTKVTSMEVRSNSQGLVQAYFAAPAAP